METILYHRPKARYCLLWKDFMQVRSTLIAIVWGGLLIQLLMLVAQRWFEYAPHGTPMIACIAPILFAIGACGMLVGNEREDGSWEWSSSLPLSWRSAVASKLFVALAGAVATGAVLAVIPVVLLLTGRIVVVDPALAIVFFSSLTILAVLEVIAYFCLASLLLRDTLTALVIAGLALCAGQIVIPALSLEIAMEGLVSWGLTEESAGLLILYGSSMGILLVGMVAMLVAFQWRWTTGQISGLAMRANPTASAPPTAAYAYLTTQSPGSWRVLLRLALVSSLWLRASAVALVCLMPVTPRGLDLVLLVLAAGILGLSAFEGDQAHQRYRFLADRGVAPWEVVVSRLGIASTWMLAMWCILAYTPLRSAGFEWTSAIVLCGLAFLGSALAAICFRKPVVAGTVSMVALLSGLITYGLAINYVIEHREQFGLAFHSAAPYRVLRLSLMWSPLAMLVLLAAIFIAARRWIVHDGRQLPVYFMAALVLAVVLPFIGVCISLF